MTKDTFSQFKYQEDLIKRLNTDTGETVSNWIYFQDKKSKVWKIRSNKTEFIDDLVIKTILPSFKEEVLAVANIQEKEVLIVDLDAYVTKSPSEFRIQNPPKNYKCITLKGGQVGLLANILPSYVQKDGEQVEEVSIEDLINTISKEDKE